MNSIVLICGHEFHYGEFPPRPHELVWCDECGQFRDRRLAPPRESHEYCDHPKTTYARQKCRRARQAAEARAEES